MHLSKYFILTLFAISGLASCTPPAEEEVIEVEPSLRNAYADNFFIGTAMNAGQINQVDSIESALIKKEFSSITAENIMKWMHIHPAADTFNFDLPDKLVDFGEENDMFVLGHTLVWHSQLAPWVHEISDSTELMNAVKKHIDTIAGRYAGKVDGWDVLNEALNGDGSLRESIFLKVAGEGYIPQIFQWAAEADPNAELYYNDYSMTDSAKRQGAIRMIKSIQDAGIKIDGVGMQGHWGLNGPSIEQIETSILEYAALGIKVMITELDVTVLPAPWDRLGAEISDTAEGSDVMNPYPDGLPDSVNQLLTQRYEDIFKLFLKHQDKISRVTFWGTHNGQSWKNNWPIRGRTDYTLVFDRNLNPTDAYKKIMALKEENEM